MKFFYLSITIENVFLFSPGKFLDFLEFQDYSLNLTQKQQKTVMFLGKHPPNIFFSTT